MRFFSVKIHSTVINLNDLHFQAMEAMEGAAMEVAMVKNYYSHYNFENQY